MLVLSRRPSEKILFPNLGISVEIIQTKGNTVRVGIEAPPEIRVLRDELAEPEDFEPNYALSLSQNSDVSGFGKHQKDQLCQQIDDIGLAIALAQNQQRQGLTDNVDVALEQAIERLQDLKDLVMGSDSVRSPEQSAVCEPRANYQRNLPAQTSTRLQLAKPNDLNDKSSRTNFMLTFELSLAD